MLDLMQMLTDKQRTDKWIHMWLVNANFIDLLDEWKDGNLDADTAPACFSRYN